MPRTDALIHRRESGINKGVTLELGVFDYHVNALAEECFKAFPPVFNILPQDTAL